MNATLLQMATMRRLTMSFMPNAVSTKAEATKPIALVSITIALWATIAGTITPHHQRETGVPVTMALYGVFWLQIVSRRR
jgi:hypothetical protein